MADIPNPQRSSEERLRWREAERALAETTARYERLLDTIPCVLYDYVRWPDGRSRFLYVSPRCEDIFEHDAETILAHESLLWDMVHPDDVERLRREDREANESGSRFQSEVRIVPPSGVTKWIQLTSRPSAKELDGHTLWSGVILDITERKRAEDEKERAVVRLQQALAEVRTLSGLLPICSYCKKVRDDRGYWSQIEAYVSEHSEAQFSHGICPECLAKHFPEMLSEDEDEGKA